MFGIAVIFSFIPENLRSIKLVGVFGHWIELRRSSGSFVFFHLDASVGEGLTVSSGNQLDNAPLQIKMMLYLNIKSL